MKGIISIYIIFFIFNFIKNECGDGVILDNIMHYNPESCFNSEVGEGDKEFNSEADSCCHFKMIYKANRDDMETHTDCIGIKNEENEKQRIINMYLEDGCDYAVLKCKGDELIDPDTGRCYFTFPYSKNSCFQRQLSENEKTIDDLGLIPDACCYSKIYVPNLGYLDYCLPRKASEINKYIGPEFLGVSSFMTYICQYKVGGEIKEIEVKYPDSKSLNSDTDLTNSNSDTDLTNSNSNNDSTNSNSNSSNDSTNSNEGNKSPKSNSANNANFSLSLIIYIFFLLS